MYIHIYLMGKIKLFSNSLRDLDTQIVLFLKNLTSNLYYKYQKILITLIYKIQTLKYLCAILNLVLCSRKTVIYVYIIIFLTSYFKQIVDHSLILFLIEIHILKKIKTIIQFIYIQIINRIF